MSAAAHPRSPNPLTLRNLLLAVMLLAVVLAPFFQGRLVSQLAQNTILWTRPPLGPGDIYSPWFGVRASLRGIDPYSPQVTRQIQAAVYGQALPPGSKLDPMAYVYPAHLVFLLAPFAWLPWNAALFGFTLLGAPLLAATAWAWVRLCLPNPSRMTMFLVVVLAMSSWPAVSACYGRQPTLLILALVAFALLLFRRGPETAPGILLAFSTVKPNLVALLLVWLLVVAAAQRRFRFLLAFAVTLALLLAGSLILVPGWIPRWIAAVSAYSHQSGKATLLASVFGFPEGVLAMACLAAAVLYRLVQISAPRSSLQFSGGVALLLAATSCLIPANPWMLYNNLLLIPPVLLLCRWRPAFIVASLIRTVALLAVAANFVCVPLCVVCGWIVGYRPVLAVLPFFASFLLPLVVVPAILCCDWRRVDDSISEPKETPAALAAVLSEN